jgi:superfamily I DNA/RNA helicase
MIYSEQQLEVIECLKKDLNISINAVAGSGKTSSSLLIAESFPDKKVLLLTFNRFLADESEKRAKLSNLNNIEVKTFHAFFGKAFKRACPNDKPLLEIIESNATTDLGSEYDIIIFDEIQDLNITLYQLLVRVFKRLKKGALICVFGDVRQAVYAFSGGSAVFLKEASELFNFNGKN